MLKLICRNQIMHESTESAENHSFSLSYSLKNKRRKHSNMRSHKEMDLVSNFMGLPSDRAETTTRPPLSMENLVEFCRVGLRL